MPVNVTVYRDAQGGWFCQVSWLDGEHIYTSKSWKTKRRALIMIRCWLQQGLKLTVNDVIEA